MSLPPCGWSPVGPPRLYNAARVHGVLLSSVAVTIAAIGLALVKFRIIMREFMDVRHAPPVLRRLTDLWVAVIGVALLASYLVGRAVA